jgi:hypothetical protein
LFKLSTIVRVCAGRAIAVVAHSTKAAHAVFPKFRNMLSILGLDCRQCKKTTVGYTE